MGRKKIKQEYIQNEEARKVAYKKRVKNILKKTEQLSVLCGAEACAIIYGPDDQVPVVWPPNEEDARRTILAFKSKRLEEVQTKPQLNQEISLQQKVKEAAEELMKLKIRTRVMEMENVITDVMTGKLTFEQVPPTDLADLFWVIDDKLKTIEKKIAITKAGNTSNNHTLATNPNDNEDPNLNRLNVMSNNDGKN